jgi:hypothetical protein
MKAFKPKYYSGMSRDRRSAFAVSMLWVTGMLILLSSGYLLLAQEADRLMAAVNGSVITEGDLYVFRAYRDLAAKDNESLVLTRQEEIDRLINLELIRQELENLNIDPGDENAARARYEELRDHCSYPGGAAALLERFGIQEPELISFLKLEISIEKLVEFRFRPFVHVTAEEIKAYYKEKLAPPLEKEGVALPPLDSVSVGIERNLKEEKVNEELEEWFKDARGNARIEYFDSGDAGASEPGIPGNAVEKGNTE